jgi:hypothetical protein
MSEAETDILKAINKHLRDGDCHPEIQVLIVVHLHQSQAATPDELSKLTAKVDASTNQLADVVAANQPA